jgi:hypothetical protein
MGIPVFGSAGHWPLYDARGATVLDLGGGPVSMLLKAVNLSVGIVVDPGRYPEWIYARYEHAGVEYDRQAAEDWNGIPGYQEFGSGPWHTRMTASWSEASRCASGT